jgi:hypothetical protein
MPVPALNKKNTWQDNQRYQTVIFWTAAVLAALWIDFGAFHRLHDADSIVPVLVSLYRWTPFYWEQDRLGMLVPLLAIPFRNPVANLLAQSAFNVFCGLAVFFLCARYVARRAWLFTGALSASLFLLFNSRQTRFDYLGVHPYGVGMFLGLAGLLLLENSKFPRLPRIILSLICLLAASWVNTALIFVLLPLIVFRWFFDRRKFQGGIALALMIFSFLANYAYCGIVSYSAAYGDWPYPPVRPWRLPAVWFQFGKIVLSEYLIGPWGIAVASLLVLGIFFRLLSPGSARAANAPALNLIASSLVSFLLMGGLAHTENSSFDARFSLQSMVLLQLGAVIWAVLPVYARFGRGGRRILTATGISLFLSAPACLYGRPSLVRVRADIDKTTGKYTSEILQSGATHIVGDYWKVWPATFHANLALYESGSSRRVWGVTIRSTPTEKFWSQIPQKEMRLAAVAGDREVRPMLDLYSFPAVNEERRLKDIVILKPVLDAE